MGLSISAAAAIIGVSLLISIQLIVGSIFPATSNFVDSFNNMKNRVVEHIETDINISNVATSANVSNYDLNVTVKNTGSTVLETCNFNVLINGIDQDFICTDSYLYPEQSTYFNVYNLPGEGSRKLKVVSDNGISDYYEYTI